jgi:hypothetical protein
MKRFVLTIALAAAVAVVGLPAGTSARKSRPAGSPDR